LNQGIVIRSPVGESRLRLRLSFKRPRDTLSAPGNGQPDSKSIANYHGTVPSAWRSVTGSTTRLGTLFLPSPDYAPAFHCAAGFGHNGMLILTFALLKVDDNPVIRLADLVGSLSVGEHHCEMDRFEPVARGIRVIRPSSMLCSQAK